MFKQSAAAVATTREGHRSRRLAGKARQPPSGMPERNALFAAACFVAGFAGFLLPLLLGALALWLFG